MKKTLFLVILFCFGLLMYLPYLKAGWGTKPCPLPVGPNVVIKNPANFNLRNNQAQQKPVPLNVNVQNNLADYNFMLTQYKIFCHNSKDDEILNALSSTDVRVRFAAVLVAGEKNLDINDKIYDLLSDENAQIQQAARKALAVKSYFLLKEIKEYNYTKEQKNKISPVNPNNLKIGIDYVDFGPLPHDNNNLTNNSVVRWKSWFSIRENELRSLKK